MSSPEAAMQPQQIRLWWRDGDGTFVLPQAAKWDGLPCSLLTEYLAQLAVLSGQILSLYLVGPPFGFSRLSPNIQLNPINGASKDYLTVVYPAYNPIQFLL